MTPPGPYGERSWRMFCWRLPHVLHAYRTGRQYAKWDLGMRWLFWMLW